MDALGVTLPSESRAPCASCVQCPGSAAADLPVARPDRLATFHPETRCCTYLPLLRNFQVGATLADADAALAPGQASVRARIARRVGVTPLGLLWPASFDRAYGEDNLRDFGRRVDLRCPHYLHEAGGLCGVWRHRNATCATWFCRYERGEVGRRLWRAVQGLLDAAEEILAWWAVEEGGLDPACRDRLWGGGPEGRLDGDLPVTDERYVAVWGAYVGREEAWYRQAAARVDALAWDDVRRIGGGRLSERLDALHDALDDHGNLRLPPFLDWGEPSEVAREAGVGWWDGYRAYDPVPLPEEVEAALREGGVGTPAEVAGRVAARTGAAPAGDELRAWLDRGVLRAALPGTR
jgi:hypothetical protein